MWVGNPLARVLWIVVTLVRHFYVARVRRMELAEGIMVISTGGRIDGPKAWQTLPTALVSVDGDDGNEHPQVESIKDIIGIVWEMKSVIYVHITYAYPIDEWERRGSR